MANTPILLREQHYREIKSVLIRLRHEAAARVVFLIDKAGQAMAEDGEVGDLDMTSLASLAAGNVAATGGMAKLIGEKEFPTLSHEGENESLYICVISHALLVVVFDGRSSLGLVKLRVKQIARELTVILDAVARAGKEQTATEAALFADITDEDIDNLFT